MNQKEQLMHKNLQYLYAKSKLAIVPKITTGKTEQHM